MFITEMFIARKCCCLTGTVMFIPMCPHAGSINSLATLFFFHNCQKNVSEVSYSKDIGGNEA